MADRNNLRTSKQADSVFLREHRLAGRDRDFAEMLTQADTKRALLSVGAGNCNTGFIYFAIDHRILDNGQSLMLLEPVHATISISTRLITAINTLNHAGQRTARTLETHSGQFTLDCTGDRTLYLRSGISVSRRGAFASYFAASFESLAVQQQN